MRLEQIQPLLDRINGCTFASIDAVTFPSPGIREEVTGRQVILFTNKTGSGYEKMVKRRLEESGKNPDDFVISDLPWGERLPESPIIVHRDEIYIQTVLLNPGKTAYYIGDEEIDPREAGIKPKRPNQGLDEPVLVATYKLKSIKKITLFGETIGEVEEIIAE